MDPSSFDILEHNYLRTHYLVLVAHVSKHMKFKFEVKSIYAHKFQKIASANISEENYYF